MRSIAFVLANLSVSCGLFAASTAMLFRGLCDASAVAPLSGNHVLVAGDEDNVLRAYDLTTPGMPLYSMDMSQFLQVDPKEPEVDIEAAAPAGDVVYWISSHGRNASGKERPSRHRFFATRIDAARVEPVGKPYTTLLQDLIGDARLAPFQLAAASGRAPKARGALNIEGLAVTPEGHLLIGFRNPIPGRKALVVPMLNPADVVRGERAKLGDPVLLDLGGYGIRSIESHAGRYVIVAGDFDGGGTSRLYEWDGKAPAPKRIPDTSMRGFNPEAVTLIDDGRQLFLLSDDGTRNVDGTECKKLKDATRKSFRAFVMDWPGN